MVQDIRPSDERYLPDEYTTEAIQAMQNMTLNNRRDFLKYAHLIVVNNMKEKFVFDKINGFPAFCH